MATRFMLPRFGEESLDGEAPRTRLALTLPSCIAAMMMIVGYTLANIAGVDGTQLIWPYLSAGMAISTVCIFFYIFVQFLQAGHQAGG